MINCSIFFQEQDEDNMYEDIPLICPSPIEEDITFIPINNDPFEPFSINEMDDFELFYKIFISPNETEKYNNENQEEYENNYFISFKQLEFQEKKLIFSEVEDCKEEIIFVEINDQKYQNKEKEEKEIEEKKEKELIFEIKKEKKNNKNKIFKYSKIKKCKGVTKKIDKYFPFNKPRGEIFSSEDNQESMLSSNEHNLPFKFITKKYFIANDGKKKIIKKKRKFKSDDIHKKIKSRFHKTLKNIINKNLKKAGSKQLFYFLPQCFIEKVSKKANAEYLHLTYKELLSRDFFTELNKNYYDINLSHNKKVLEYLEQNKEISIKSGFDLIKDMEYEELLNKYFNSLEFEDSINQLINEKETPEYIYAYINRAKNYVNFYSNVKTDNSVIINIDDNKDVEEEEE